MNRGTTASALRFRQALAEDSAQVAAVLTAAALNLEARGQTLWKLEDVSEAAIAQHVRDGRYFMAEDDEDPAGVFRFDVADAMFWPEIAAGTSGFIHKVAVHPRVQGRAVAQQLLAHAVEVARGRELPFVRLDCRAGRPALSSVYERFGFRHHSTLDLGGGALFERYELAVPPVTRRAA